MQMSLFWSDVLATAAELFWTALMMCRSGTTKSKTHKPKVLLLGTIRMIQQCSHVRLRVRILPDLPHQCRGVIPDRPHPPDRLQWCDLATWSLKTMWDTQMRVTTSPAPGRPVDAGHIASTQGMSVAPPCGIDAGGAGPNVSSCDVPSNPDSTNSRGTSDALTNALGNGVPPMQGPDVKHLNLVEFGCHVAGAPMSNWGLGGRIRARDFVRIGRITTRGLPMECRRIVFQASLIEMVADHTHASQSRQVCPRMRRLFKGMKELVLRRPTLPRTGLNCRQNHNGRSLRHCGQVRHPCPVQAHCVANRDSHDVCRGISPEA